MSNLSTTYNPKEFEDRIYKMWEEGKFFSAKPDASKEPYSIMLPPPNITGQLHMGHALDHTLQDILIRQKRMAGYSVLWQPGTDHASIATEVKVVERIKEEEGLTKLEIGREEFLKRAWEWKDEFGGRIVEQMKKLGDSCDWERERFTMDEGLNKAVTEFFIKLYDEGYIYRGNRIINWCPDCKTSLSDAEVEHDETHGKFYHFYYVVNETGEKLEVATTRPETILGDTGLAVNPDDERYQKYIGMTVKVPYIGRDIPIVADDYVDIDFGTGVVKVTPAHDPNDFEIGQRHSLAQIRVMDDGAVMNDKAGKYKGMTRYECREAIIKDLTADGLIAKVKEHDHNVGHCYRCQTVVEPILSKQWFVKMKDLAQPAIEVVENKELEIIPERFEKTYFNWLHNIRDWNISRQLWWGHRIPAYYCQDCDEIIVAKTMPDHCKKCGSSNLKQDEDVLDTWFSSALWPFSTLGWPDDTAMLRYFYPTSVLVTGYDIIFFWVVRMVFSAMFCMEEIPFKHVLLHGIVRDEEGRKMSKSLGNGIDPLDVIDQYGADALRFTLATGNTPGNDMRFSYERVETSRNFANKIWNASRFILMNMENCQITIDEKTIEENREVSDKWIISRLNKVAKDVTHNIDKFEIGMAADKIYEFAWSEFCDWYIELIKPRLYSEDQIAKQTALSTAKYVLEGILKLLHPFMPFITEEIYSKLEEDQKIIVATWPVFDEKNDYEDSIKMMDKTMEAIRAIRNARAEMNVPPSRKATVKIAAESHTLEALQTAQKYLLTMASASEVEFISKGQEEADALSIVIDGAEIFIPLAEIIDIEKELERLGKELSKFEGEIKRAEGKLNNQGFVAKAPQSLIDEEKAKIDKYKEMKATLEERINQLKK